MARASYLTSARAMARGPPPLAWFCAATWQGFTPPLTLDTPVCSGTGLGIKFFVEAVDTSVGRPGIMAATSAVRSIEGEISGQTMRPALKTRLQR